MQEVYKILIGIGVVILGFPIGYFLAKITSDELRASQLWFKLIIISSIVGAIITLIISNDALFFTFLFFASVTSMSLRPKKTKKSGKQ